MKERKRIVALCTVLIMLINMFSPYTLLIGTAEASTGTIEEKPVIFNNLGITTKGSNKILTVEIAIVSEEIINGLDLQFKVDRSKITPCNKNTGAASSVITLNSTQSDYCLSTFQKKTYTASTGTYRLMLTEPKGGTDIVNDLGYIPGAVGDDAIDVNGDGFPAYYPLIKLFFKVVDSSLDTDNLVLDDLFTLVPVTASLPTGMKISYKNASALNVSRDISVIGSKGFATASKTVSTVSVKSNPTKTTYTHGDTIDLAGGTITVTYDDGSTEDISMTDEKVSISSGNPADVNDPKVTIKYGDAETSFDITVNDPVESLDVKTSMSNVEYIHGDSIDFTGLTLEATKKSGSKVSLTQSSDGVTTSESTASIDSATFTKTSPEGEVPVKGTQKIKFTYEGKEATQTIIVNDTISSISLISQPSKTVYKYGESLDLTGATVKVTLGSGSTTNIDLPDGSITVGTYNPRTVGRKQNLSVGLGSITASDTIDVEAYNYVVSSTLTAPTKNEYKYNESLNVAGGKIKLTWKSGTISNVNLTTDMVSGFNPTKVGEQKLTVTYDLNYTLSDGTTIADKIVDEYYVVVVNTAKSIDITAPTKTTYNYGDSLDLTGGAILVTYENGDTKNVTMTSSMITESDGKTVDMTPSTFDSSNTLTKTLKVTYSKDSINESVNYPITIINDIKSIAMHTTPKTDRV